ncbi:MAG: hypothetical protein G01um101456_519 [Parcubacteria group bacterium Gr01-1014_56]|nr:MAG: hypothetical protein G01um101456_519 [Parcubacteria group bacterium Gr01-1014_56]
MEYCVSYSVTLVLVPFVGSTSTEDIYVGTKQGIIFTPEELLMSVEEAVGIVTPEQVNIPLLSAIFCPIALRIVCTLLWRCALRAWANWRAGLMAIITIAASIAIIPMTIMSSMRVNPLRRRSRVETDPRTFLKCFIKNNCGDSTTTPPPWQYSNWKSRQTSRFDLEEIQRLP